jgi:hypothetical protein
MASERLPTSDLSAVERVKREHRRDMPFGLSTSLILHGCFVILFAGAATALYVESKIQAPQEQRSQIITIETLVRTPQTVVQKQQPTVIQTVSRSAVAVKQTTSQTTPHVTLLATHPANPQTQTGVSTLGTFSVLQGAAGTRHGAKKHKATQDQSKAAAQQVTASTGAQSAATSTTIYTAPNNGNTAADDEAAAGGYMSSGHGPVWSEHPPAGPGGGGVDTCTPSRGGFFVSPRH